jgi:hypothetical protein
VKSIRTVSLTLALMAMILSSVSFNLHAQPVGQSKPDPRVVAKLAQILERSGYTYKKAADNVWVVNFHGSSLSDIDVFVTSAENLVVIGAVVAPKKSMKVTPEMMHKLLRLAHDIDRVKIGFDDDEDLFVRSEVAARLFDLDEFKSDIEQVAAGTDKVHAAIKSYLAK